MDFGSILDEWDGLQKKQPEKKNDATPKRSGLSLKCNANEKKTVENKPTTGTSPKKVTSSKTNTQSKANPMDIWLRRYGVTDKDAIEEKERQKDEFENRDYIRTMTPEARIDLHGLTRDEAWEKLEMFIGECVKRGLRKVLIIHGKGNHSSDAPVLDAMVRTFIEKDSRLGASGHPDKTLGGKGATWVVIRPTYVPDKN